jgi:hypothetical protein
MRRQLVSASRKREIVSEFIRVSPIVTNLFL